MHEKEAHSTLLQVFANTEQLIVHTRDHQTLQLMYCHKSKEKLT